MEIYYTEDGLRYYQTPVGNFPSVTTILRETESEKEKEKLRKWQHKMDKVHGTGAAEKESTEAKERGTNTHKLIEEFLKGSQLNFPSDPYFAQALPILRMLKSKWEAIEEGVYHENDGYAGRLDLLAVFNDRASVMDFTTSKRLKRKQWINGKFLQCSAYAIAHNWLYKGNVDNLVVIVLSPKKMQIFEDDLQTWQPSWEERLEQFYQKGEK